MQLTFKKLAKSFGVTVAFLVSFCTVSFSQSILDPNDPIIDYNKANPQQVPPFNNTIYKWVRTPRVNWNTSAYKAYYINGFGFRLMFPTSYVPGVNDNKKFPLLIMFHGLGELGEVQDNELQLVHAAQHHLNARNAGKYDGYALFMQNRTGDWGPAHFTAINRVIEYMILNNKVDPDRIVIHGLSAGGRGAWQYLLEHPKYVAAALPMSAVLLDYSSQSNMAKYKFTPLWLFQGGLDQNPRPDVAEQVAGDIEGVGGNFKYRLYPNIGHSTWYNAYDEPDFYPFINRAHKANPHVLFYKKTYCKESPVNSVIGVTPGFDGYEWRRNGELIAGATSNTINVFQAGSYQARIRRGSVWSDWSPIPAVVENLPEPPAPAISVVGASSTVLPALDGATTVDIRVADGGGGTFAWYKLPNTTTPISTNQVYRVTAPGTFTAKSTNNIGCVTLPATNFVIASAIGSPKPDPASSLLAIPQSETSIQLSWSQKQSPSSEETGFEVYRATSSGGPYTFVALTAANASSFINTGLLPNTTYYYIIRAVNTTGASMLSNEAFAKTVVDNVKPLPPNNLIGSGFSENSITISWQAATDNIGVVGYDVYMDGVLIGSTTTQLTYTATGLTRNQGYNFHVVAKDASGNFSNNSNQVRLFAVRQGLNYKYYHGTWSELPNFATLTPVKTGRTNNVNLTPRVQNDNFGFLWEGFIKITTAGSYTFRTNSDDGSKLYLSTYSHTATELVNNDGLHGSQNRDGTITLNPGIYPIAITFFERGGGESMTISWRIPGSSSFVAIPDDVFVDYVPPAPVLPALPTDFTVAVVDYKSLRLNWTDQANNETGYEIYRTTSSNGTTNSRIIFTTAANATSYVDEGLAQNTNYYYRIRAINEMGNSEFSAVRNARTATRPAAPPVPTGLTGSVIAINQIDLSFTGVANSDVNFGIYRSTNNIDFFKIGSVPGTNSGTAYTYTDNTVVANTQFFYRVRAEHIGGNNSAYSSTINLVTGNRTPVFNPISTVFMRSDASKQVLLTATDADADQLSFTGTTLPGFAQLSNNANNTATLTLTPEPGQLGTFPVTVRAVDANGGTVDLSFNVVVNNNVAPTVEGSPGAIYTINEGENVSFTLSATDPENNSISWSVSGLPGFGTTEEPAANSFRVSLNPYYTDAGEYPLTITADDGNGGVVETVVLVRVLDAEAGYHIYVNFSQSAPNSTLPSYWNNTNKHPIAGDIFSNFKSFNGFTTPVGLQVIDAWQNSAAQNVGRITGNNSGVYPDEVLKSTWVGPSHFTPGRNIDITGLSPKFRYTLVFLGNRNDASNPTADRRVRYTVGGKSGVLNATNNVSQTVTISDLTPNADGKLRVLIEGITGFNSGIYLTAMEIIASLNDGTLPLPADDISVTEVTNPVPGNRITWTDKAFNETSYQVFRSVNLEGPYTGLTQLRSNATSFLDENIEGNTTYYYFVQAGNNAGNSNSDTVSILTKNIAPKLSPIESVFMRSGTSKTVVVSATDTEGETLRLSASGMPSFISFVDNRNGTGWFTVNPVSGQEGTYTIRVTARDDFDLSTSLEFRVTVLGMNENRLLINLNPSTATNEAFPYNNLASNPTAARSINLVNSAGEATGIVMELVEGWTTTYLDGRTTGNNSGVFTDKVMGSGIFESTATSRTIRFKNLPTGKKFTFELFGSRITTDGLDRNVQYSVNGNTVQLKISNNNGATVQLNEALANTSNQIDLIVSRGTGNTQGLYLNAIAINILDNDGRPSKPSNVTATPVSRTQIRLNWKDNSGGELGYRVFRSNSLNGTYNLIASLPANTTVFTDNGLTANTRYYYTVRAFALPISSEQSEKVTARTFIHSTYVNFSQNNAAPAPWNNTNRVPQVGTIMTLQSDLGTSSGITLSIVENFQGVNPFGSITGNNTGVYPDNVMSETYWVDAGRQAILRLSGLNPQQKYNFTFFASRGAEIAASSIRITDYIINDNDTVRLDAAFNTTRTVTAYEIVANGAGEAFIKVVPSTSTNPVQSFGYIGALVIDAYTNEEVVPGTLVINEGSGLATRSNSDEQLEAGSIAAYPNPFSNTLSLMIEAPMPLTDASVAIYNMAGRVEFVRVLGDLSAGKHQIRVPVDQRGLQRGLYILQVTDKKGFRKVIKVIKQ